MASNHYETLRISTTASPEEIRKSRLRLIRQFPPERSPAEFQAINQAYQVLSDPDARAEYDAERLHGAQIGELLIEAGQRVEADNHAEAIPSLKRILVLHSRSRAAWNLLGICYTQTRQWELARKAFHKLLPLEPGSALFRLNYAVVYLAEAETLGEGRDADKRRLTAEARTHLTEAQRLEPHNLAVLRSMARSYSVEGDHARAATTAEELIRQNTTKVEVDDYMYLAQRYLLSDQMERVPSLAQQLTSEMPTEEGRTYAGAVFAKFALELFQLGNFSNARNFIHAAAVIAPTSEAVLDIKRDWDAIQEASDEYDRLAEDSVVIPPLRHLMAVFCDESRGLPLPKPRDEIFSTVAEALSTYDSSEVVAAARRIRKRYPAVYRLQSALVDHLESK